MLATLDWLIIVGFLALSLSIGIFLKKRASKDLSSFFLGGRNLPWYVAGISMVATTFAADTPLAVTELVAKYGISGNWLWWNFLAGGMLTTFFFARLWRRAEVLTELEFIDIRYSGKVASFLRGFKAIYYGIFLNALILGWVNIAMMSILKIFFNIPEEQLMWYIFAAMGIAALYSSLSGLLGVAITDMIQFVIAITGCIILAVIILNTPEVGGIEGLKAQLPSTTFDFFPQIGESSSLTGGLVISLGAFLAHTTMQWWASWYPGAEPGGGGYIAQRMMSAKNEKHAIWATLFFQIAHYCLRPWPWIIVGLGTLILYPDLADPKEGFVLAMKDHLPVGLKGLLLVSFLAAYMSTVSTQLNWGASYLINDFYKKFFDRPGKSNEEKNKKYIFLSRFATILLMLLSVWVTTMFDQISGIWEFIIECGAGVGLVLILRWYWWRINAWSELTATIVPIISYAVARFSFNLEFPESFFFTTGITSISWITITYLTPPVEKEKLLAFHRKIKPGGNWKIFKGEEAETGLQGNMALLFLAWFSSIVFTYSILFATGKLIFHEWIELILYFCLALIAFIVLRYCVIRTKIFND